MSDYIYTDYGFCPDCGEPRGVCVCAEYRAADAAIEEMDDWGDYEAEPIEERLVCPICNGTGGGIDDCEECDHCDGLGYEWWLP